MGKITYYIAIPTLCVLLTIVRLVSAVPPTPAPADVKCKISCTVTTLVELPGSDPIEIGMKRFSDMKKNFGPNNPNSFYTNGNADIIIDNGNDVIPLLDIEIILEEYQLKSKNPKTDQPLNCTIAWDESDNFLHKRAEMVPASKGRDAVVIISAKTSSKKVPPRKASKTSGIRTITVCWVP